MQPKSLLILSGVTVAALLGAVLSVQQKSASKTRLEERFLFPELSEHVNDVTKVHIEKAGKSATIEKTAAGWTLADRGGYPALIEKVKELVVRMASLEIEESKTAKKANHEQLGVAWPPAEAAEGDEPSEIEAGLVTLQDASGKDLASLVIGKSEWQGQKPKLYARRASEDQVYLCSVRGSQPLDANPEAKSWIEPKFLELANDRVQTVTIEHHDGEKVSIARSAANHTQFALQNLAPGQEEKYQGIATGVAQTLGYGLTLEDVRPVGQVDFTADPVARTTFRTVDGLVLTLDSARADEQVWIQVAARYEAPPEPVEPEKAEGEDEGQDPAEEIEEAKPDVPKEAAELNERLSPWAFAIPAYKTDSLTRRLKDLLAEPAPALGDDGGLQGLLDGMGITDEEMDLPVEAAPPADDEGSQDSPAPADDGGAPK